MCHERADFPVCKPFAYDKLQGGFFHPDASVSRFLILSHGPLATCSPACQLVSPLPGRFLRTKSQAQSLLAFGADSGMELLLRSHSSLACLTME